MPITKERGIVILKKTIQQDLRHIDYKRVCDLASEYKKYATGEDIDELLKQFTAHESDELFIQRKAMTSLTTPDIMNTLTTPMYKVGRITANQSIYWSDKEKTSTKKADLTKIASEFYGKESVENYLTLRLPSLDRTDPNSFIIVEFKGEVDPAKPETKANPYPFEANAEEAINFQYINNILQWLIVLTEDQTKYTMYLDDDSIVAIKVKKDDKGNIPEGYIYDEIWYKDESSKDSEYVYLVSFYNHKAGMMPAFRVGTVLDEETRYRTCVPIIHPARTYLKKTIKTVSEFDLTTALHTFPKTYRYGNPCPGDMKSGILCDAGYTLDKIKCPICKGTGWDAQTTTASEVIVRAPKELKDMVTLENMLAYKAPPSDLIEFQKKLGIYELRECAIKAVYNSDTYVRDTTASTATEKNIDLESVYDTLKPFADTWSKAWKHIMNLIASYRDLASGITIEHSFPKDFKMKSLPMLLDDLKKANDSGAPSYIKKSIIHDIAKKIYVDHPDELLKIQVKEKFFPFNGKSENEINAILNNDVVTKYDRVLYAKFDSVFTDIENEVNTDETNFYNMEYKKQSELVKKTVQEYIRLLDEEDTQSRALSFGKVDPNAEVI